MRFPDVYRKLMKHRHPVFTLEELCVFYPEEKRVRLRLYLSRWKKKGWIRSLKRGLYELSYLNEIEVPDFYIANRMYGPSYISLETALSHYGLIPEVSMGVVSVTTKATRRFKNDYGFFLYRSVRPEFFRGYLVENHQGFDVLIAEPEKALVDFLYFKTLRGGRFDKYAERIDLLRVEKLNQKKLKRYAQNFRLNVAELLNA